MSAKKQDQLKINKSKSHSASLMAVQSKLGLFENKKKPNNEEAHQFLKKTPMAFL